MKSFILFVLLGGINVECRGGHTPFTPLPTPPPIGTGLYSALLKLQKQVNDLEQLHESDRTRLKRLERRKRHYRDTVIKTQEEVVQLRQHIVELQERFTSLEELSTDVKLDISRLDYEHKEIKKELTSVKEIRPIQNDQVFEVKENMSRLLSVKEDLNQNYKSLMEDVGQLQKQEKENNHVIHHLKQGYDKVVRVLTTHVQDLTKHGDVDTVKLSPHNHSLIWTHVDLESGDGSGDMNLETLPSKSDPSESEGSGEGDELDRIATSLPHFNLSQHQGILNLPDLQQRLFDLEDKVQEKLDKFEKTELEQRTDDLLKKHDSYFEQEIIKRDNNIQIIEHRLQQLVNKVEGVENRVVSLQLGDFMQKLQESMINFTQNVITLDQWKMASDQIINTTQINQDQINQMTTMILNNTRGISQTEWKLNDQQLLTDQQYRVLRMHLIRLNNTVQDMKEQLQYLGSSRGPGGQASGHGTPSGEVMSRVEDISLQIIYNENRIANIESKVLNKSLSECAKSNKDLNQDSRLLVLEKETTALSSQGALLNELIKRVDRAVYRVHGISKNNTVYVNKMWNKVTTWQLYMPIINLMRQELSNLLTQVPMDCDGYYKRGYQESGKYVIFPKKALQSVFVYCSMENDGGWTVIQKRTNGKLDFRRPWDEYAIGFGSADDEYWLGNEFIHLITVNDNYTLRIEMTDIFKALWLVEYEDFSISTKEENYKLHVNGFHGNATDGMDYSNDMAFSTQDKDNDLSSTHCALYFTSGWWYRHCQYSNLNGRYDTGIVWFNRDWQDWIQMKQTLMKIKPKS